MADPVFIVSRDSFFIVQSEGQDLSQHKSFEEAEAAAYGWLRLNQDKIVEIIPPKYLVSTSADIIRSPNWWK